MPSPLHEGLVSLFRDRPALAPELLIQALRADVPEYTEARIDSAELTDIRPTEYRADVVVQLRRDDSVFGIVVEVQLSRDEDKGFVWPVYITTLRNRIRCPVGLLVVAPDAKVANWARQPIVLGGESRVIPWVLHAADIPEIMDFEEAETHPELAVLSALAHGRDSDPDKSARIAFAAENATAALDTDRSGMYVDLIRCCLSEAAREVLAKMDPLKYQFQSEVGRRVFSQGKAEGLAEGLAEGRVELALALLSRRLGKLPEVTHDRILRASAEELTSLVDQLLSTEISKEEVSMLG